MKPFTIWLEPEQVEMLEDEAKRMKVPKHAWARSVLVRALESSDLNQARAKEVICEDEDEGL